MANKKNFLLLVDDQRVSKNIYNSEENILFERLIYNEIKNNFNVETLDCKKIFLEKGFKEFNKFLEKFSKNFDVIILFQSWFFGFDHNLFNRIKKNKPSIQLFCVDLESNEMIFIYYAKLLESFNLIFTSDSLLAAKIYNQIGIKSKFLPFVYSKEHFFNQNLPKIYDLSFIGQKHSTRPFYIDYLKANNLDVKTFGAYENQRITWKEVNKIYNSTKINLYFSFQKRRKNKIFDLTMSHNMKSSLLHFIMSKNFFLIEYSLEHDSIISEFSDLMFKNKFELLDKVNFFLNNENKRENIINDMHKKIGDKYNFENYKSFFLEEFYKECKKELIDQKFSSKLSKKYNFILNKNEMVSIDHSFFFQWNISQIKKKKNLYHFLNFFSYFFRNFNFTQILFILLIYLNDKFIFLIKIFSKK